MSRDHDRFHYSITCKTEDAAVMFCLRALCQFALRGQSTPQIGWGGTGEAEWESAGRQITLRFTDAQRRERVAEANRLFPGMWVETARSDDDPATPRRVGA